MPNLNTTTNGNSPNPDETNFSSQRTAIPFGKFESGSDDMFPCNESMVGREGARAKLIDFLINAGTRKAILITGRRGMGKSSFVEYCIDEYEKSRVERYWRSDFGRTMSSLVWLIIISLLSASVLVIGSQMLQISLHNALEKNDHFLWIPITLLVFIFSFPLFRAGHIFTVILKPFPPIVPNFLGFLLVFGFIALLLFCLRGIGSPVVTLSRLVVVISVVYYVGELINLAEWFSKKLLIIRFGHLVLLICGALAGFLTFFFHPIIVYPGKASFGQGASVFFSNLIIAIQFFGFASINKAIGNGLKLLHLKEHQIASAIEKAKFWYLGLGLGLILLPMLIVWLSTWQVNGEAGANLEIKWAEWIYSIAFIVIFTLFRWFLLDPRSNAKITDLLNWVKRQNTIMRVCLTILTMLLTLTKLILPKSEQNLNDNYRKQYVYPGVLMALKALFFIFLGLYALHPFFSLVLVPKNDGRCSWSLADEGITSDQYVRSFLNDHNKFFF